MILLVKMKDQSVHFALTLDTPPILDNFFTLAIHLSTVPFHKKSEAIYLLLGSNHKCIVNPQ